MIHAVFDPDCYGCQLRKKGIATSGVRLMRTGPATTPDPSWESGRAGEHRRDGSFMPYLNADLVPIPVKEFGENRHTFEDMRREQLSTP